MLQQISPNWKGSLSLLSCSRTVCTTALHRDACARRIAGNWQEISSGVQLRLLFLGITMEQYGVISPMFVGIWPPITLFMYIHLIHWNSTSKWQAFHIGSRQISRKDFIFHEQKGEKQHRIHQQQCWIWERRTEALLWSI